MKTLQFFIISVFALSATAQDYELLAQKKFSLSTNVESFIKFIKLHGVKDITVLE